MDALKVVLGQYWGYSGFRPLQEDAMCSVLEGRDSLSPSPQYEQPEQEVDV